METKCTSFKELFSERRFCCSDLFLLYLLNLLCVQNFRRPHLSIVVVMRFWLNSDITRFSHLGLTTESGRMA